MSNSSTLYLILPLLQVGEGNGTPLQYSCLENPMDGGAWWAVVHGVAKSIYSWWQPSNTNCSTGAREEIGERLTR